MINVLRFRNACATELLRRRLEKYHGAYSFPMPVIIVANPLIDYYVAGCVELAKIEERTLTRKLARCVSTLQRIKVAVCHEFEVSQDDLMGRSRKPGAATPRHVAMYLARRYVKRSEREIAFMFGKDHTCVRLAHRKVPHLAAQNNELARRIERVTDLLRIVA